MIDNTEKYYVFKIEEFDQWTNTLDTSGFSMPPMVEDFVVIRLQDVFAAPALHEYAMQIETTLEILFEMGVAAKLEHVGDVSGKEFKEMTRRLEHIRDYFAEKAATSQNIRRKLPD